MFYFVILLLILGIVLGTAEIFMPGFGFFGIAGMVCIAISAVYTVLYVPFGLVIVVGELALIAVGIWSVIKWAKSKQLYGNLILRENLSFEKKEAGNYESLIGKEGLTAVPMRPFGSVLFNGVKMDAYSEGPFIPKGRTVTVVNVDNDRIIVRETN